MQTLELSVQAETPSSADELRRLLEPFEREHHVNVHVTAYEWPEAWQHLLRVAIDHLGPDVSQVGSTWVQSLVSMNTLLPFSDRDIRLLGGREAFSQGLWKIGATSQDNILNAVPWMGYTVLIYYRRDWLIQAGVDENTAFSNPENFAQALQKLSEYDLGTPWSVPVESGVETVHYLVPWLWQAGMDFLSGDGRQPTFAEPTSLAALEAYFSLGRFFSPQMLQTGTTPPVFTSGQVGVTMSGPGLWFYDLQQQSAPDPQLRSNTGAALPFGKPMVGASHLVVWNHTRHPQAAAELVRYLAGPEVQREYPAGIGLLPARLETLGELQAAGDPIQSTMAQALRIGRALPPVRLWALVEEKLTLAFGDIWREVLSQEQPDLSAILKRHLVPLANMLKITLS